MLSWKVSPLNSVGLRSRCTYLLPFFSSGKRIKALMRECAVFAVLFSPHPTHHIKQKLHLLLSLLLATSKRYLPSKSENN